MQSHAITLAILILSYHTGLFTLSNSFYVPFQPKSTGSFSPSIEQWIEIRNKIASAREFTACHWIRTKYFNQDIPVFFWSYCTVDIEGEEMECIEVYLEHDNWKSANRELIMTAQYKTQNSNIQKHASVLNFKHRSWGFFCLITSSIRDETLFYYNGKQIGKEDGLRRNNETVLKKSTDVFESAIIFGQEPDSIRGSYDQYQAFIGDVSEFNIWNYVLSDAEISNMAKCMHNQKGNVVAWKKGDLKLYNLDIINMEKLARLCSADQRKIIFPIQLPFFHAKEICEIHGGRIVVPTSQQENLEVVEILKSFKGECVKSKSKMLSWLGVRKINQTWYKSNDRETSHQELSYTNWDSSSSRSNHDCAILYEDGKWHAGGRLCLRRETLCPVCSIIDTPVFTLKGSCMESDIDWNYYMVVDDKHKLTHYEGYKITELIPTIDKKGWEFVPKSGAQNLYTAKLFSNHTSKTYPLGREKWYIENPSCKENRMFKPMALSQCHFRTMFTCDSGYCIERSKRCDGNTDCEDNSDEKNCYSIHIPSSYQNQDPPTPMSNKNLLQLFVHLHLVSIDRIDTINMLVVITIRLNFRWNDPSLRFFNLQQGHDNVISSDEANKIWTPSNSLIIENEIVGKTEYGNRKEVKVKAQMLQKNNPRFSYENQVHNGSHNYLQSSQRIQVSYHCKFDVYRFPFDWQKCDLLFKFNGYKKNKVTLREFAPSAYDGPEKIDQFTIRNITCEITCTENFSRLTLSIPFYRIPFNQLLKTFVPILLLCLLVYSTLFVDIQRPGDRFMGSVTVMLVMATWISVISGDLPKTSYVKLIDIWFVWHLSISFVVVIYHIFLDGTNSRIATFPISEVKPRSQDYGEEVTTMKLKNSNIKIVNKRGATVLSLVNFTFYIIYFIISLN